MDEKRNCPHCGKPIKATAKKCIHCKQWIDDSGIQGTGQESSATTGSSSGVSPVVMMISALGVLVLGIIIYFMAQGNDNHSVAHEKDQEEVLIDMSSDAYEEKAKDDISRAIDEGYDIVNCPACNGTGETDEGGCIICLSKGKVRVKQAACEHCGCTMYIAPLNDSYCINCRETFGCAHTMLDHESD